MSRPLIGALVAGTALLTAPLGANAFTYHRGGAPMWHGGAPAWHGGGYAMRGGYGYRGGYATRGGFHGRYGYGLAAVGAAAAAVGYGAGYGGYGAGYGGEYGAGYSSGYGAGYPAAYATGPYAGYGGASSSCGCTTPTYQTATTIAYVPVTSYRAVRVYYAPQQSPYYNVPPYVVK